MIFSGFPAGCGVYMIGIGGVSMSALAVHLLSRGYRVRGSDRAESKRIRYLRGFGIPVSIGEEEKISEQIVVYTGAVDRGKTSYFACKTARFGCGGISARCIRSGLSR